MVKYENFSDIPENIQKVMDGAAAYVGRFERDQFHNLMFADILDKGMESPIEIAFYVALKTLIRLNYHQDLDTSCADITNGGIRIEPQARIGIYRADFLVKFYQYGAGEEKLARQVVVECDGTAFHERTEKERRYEKQRDRFMQKEGLQVFRFTGKEILDDSYRVAKEVLGFVTGIEDYTLTPDECLDL